MTGGRLPLTDRTRDDDDVSNFIINDDDETVLGGPLSPEKKNYSLPPSIAQLLRCRSDLEKENKIYPDQIITTLVGNIPRKFHDIAISECRRTFEEGIENTIKEHVSQDAMGVETYLDLKDYDLPNKEFSWRPMGGLKLLFSFYSRLYERLLSMNTGRKVSFFSPPIPDDQATFGFREILDFQSDFDLTQFIGRKEMESIFSSIVTTPGEKVSQREIFSRGMNFEQFTDFITLCGLADERYAPINDTPVAQLKRFLKKIKVSNGPEMKVMLHNVWRDTHFWRLRDDEPFEREAKLYSIRSVPTHRVRYLKPKYRYKKPGWNLMLKHVTKHEWLDTGPLWQKYEGSYIDMGTSFVGQNKKYKMVIRNGRQHLMKFQFEMTNCGPLTRPVPEIALNGLTPGQSVEVPLAPFYSDQKEFSGTIKITGLTASKELYRVTLPVYAKAVFPHEGEGPTGRELPPRAPRPFEKDKKAEIIKPTQPIVAAKKEGGDIISVDVGMPTFCSFVVNATSDVNLNPRTPRTYGSTPSNALNRPRSAPSGRPPTDQQRPMTAPMPRTIPLTETPRSLRPRSAITTYGGSHSRRPHSAKAGFNQTINSSRLEWEMTNGGVLGGAVTPRGLRLPINRINGDESSVCQSGRRPQSAYTARTRTPKGPQPGVDRTPVRTHTTAPDLDLTPAATPKAQIFTQRATTPSEPIERFFGSTPKAGKTRGYPGERIDVSSFPMQNK